jgi:hypothetical protein
MVRWSLIGEGASDLARQASAFCTRLPLVAP